MNTMTSAQMIDGRDHLAALRKKYLLEAAEAERCGFDKEAADLRASAQEFEDSIRGVDKRMAMH